MRKRLSIVLSLFGLLLTGCSGGGSSSRQPSASSSEETSVSVSRGSTPSSEETSSEERPSESVSSSTPSSSEEPIPSSSSEEADTRLYVYVQNGKTEGFYDVYFDAKEDLKIGDPYDAESVFVLGEGVEIQEENIKRYLYRGRVESYHFGEHVVEIGSMHLHFDAAYPEIYFDEALRSIDYIRVSLSREGFLASDGKGRVDFYFGGDCPAMEEGSIYNNGFPAMMFHYHEGAKGFRPFMQSATAVCIEEEVRIPDVSVSEYVLGANRKAREMAQLLYDRSVKAGNEEFLLFPISGLDFYFGLKDFVLDLVEKCTSDYEKARTIFDWIVDNIEYDVDYLLATVEDVFRDKKAACAGYSFLYHDMLAAAGIPSFYTDGAVLSGLPQEDIESFVRASFDSSMQAEMTNHGWVYAFVDGEAVCCEPTWGDFDMDDEYLSSTRLIYRVDGIRVLYDENFFPLIRDYAVVYYGGEFYVVSDGCATNDSGFGLIVNFVLHIDFEVNRNSKIAGGAESFDSALVIPYGAIYHDGLLYFDDPYFLLTGGLSGWKYCLSDGKTIDFMLLLRYMNEETKRYGTVFEHEFDLGFCAIENSMIYYEYEPGKLQLLTMVESAPSITVPAFVHEKKVTALGDGCFRGMRELREIHLPEGLETIRSRVFMGCSSLTSIHIPSSVKEFETCVFDSCTSLKEIELPDDMTRITNGMFNACTALEHFDIPSSVTSIDGLAFGNCSSLVEILLPEGLESLGDHAFLGCSSLEEVHIPARIEEIGIGILGRCTKLTSVTVDRNNPYFDSRENCNAIVRTATDTLVSACRTFTIPEGIRGLEYQSCRSLLGVDAIHIPSSVTYIAQEAFFECESLRHIEFGAESDLKTIERYAFYYCPALEEFVLPEGLETIEENAFADCQSLIRLVFPSTVQTIGTWIAYGARRLNEAEYRGSVEEWEAVEKDPEWYFNTSCEVVHCQNGDVALA